MNTNDYLIRKTFIGVWAVNGMSVLFGIACVMVDAVFIGQYLGSEAVAASGLIQPVTMLFNMIGGLFGPGLAVVCTRYMGMAKKEKVNQVFSLVMTFLLILLIAAGILLYISAPGIASSLGEKSGNYIIIHMVEEYLRGFAFSVVPMNMSLSLSGLMMLDNDKSRSVISMIATLASDFLFDYLNVMVFHGGMWGMAIATSLSNCIGLLIVLTHFLKKDRILNFTLKGMDFRELKEVIICGISNSVSMGSIALRGIVFNSILFGIAGSVEVAALSASNSLFSVFNAVALGLFISVSSMVSLLYGEEDRGGIIKTLRLALRIVLLIFPIITIVLCFAAPSAGRVFLDASSVDELRQSGRFIRLMAIQLSLNSLAFVMSGVYQGIRRNILNYILVVCREAVLPISCAFILSSVMGLRGFEAGLILSGLLECLLCFVIPSIVNRKPSYTADDMVLLEDDFGPAPNELFEASVRNMNDIIEASEKARRFCLKSGMNRKDANLTALFIEETAINTISYGTGTLKESSSKNSAAATGDADNNTGTGERGHRRSRREEGVQVDIKVINRKEEGRRMIRFRDNGKPFDPVKWYEINHPQDPVSGLGIRIIMGLAKNVTYLPAMGMNNLVIFM